MKMEQAHGTSTSNNTRDMDVPNVKKRGYFVTFWNMEAYPRELPRNCTYLITCEDITEDNKPHGHAFVYFKNPVALSAVRKLFGKEVHSERIFNNSGCIRYVRGEIGDERGVKHNILEHGTRPMDNGVHKIKEVVESCETITELMDNHPELYCKYRNGINDIMNEKQRKNRYKQAPKVIWTYGPTGTGKTDAAFNANARNVDYNNGFFTDWKDARIISIEEMDGQIPFKILLKLLDQYHNYYEINIKGGSKLVDLDEI